VLLAPKRRLDELIESGIWQDWGSIATGGYVRRTYGEAVGASSSRTRPQQVLSPDVPVVISEVPQTWEDLEALDPELFEPILETRPGRTPDPYPGTEAGEVVLGDPGSVGPTSAQDDVGEDEMAHDWGHLAREFIGGYLGPDQPAGGNFVPNAFVPSQPNVVTGAAGGGNGTGDCDGMAWAGGAPPKGYKVVRDSCGNGVLRKVRRRRRRRMLTSGDKDDIASIVSMVGKGQMAAALINGSMRRG